MKAEKKETAGILLRGFVALLLCFIAIAKYDYLSNINVGTLTAGIDNIALVIGIIELVYFVKAFVFVIPASLVYVAVGVILNPVAAVTVNFFGILIETVATYFLGRFLGKDYVERLLSKNKGGQKLLSMEIQNKKWVMFVIRFLPVFPIDFASLFFGASHSNFLLYVIFSVVGIAPRVILFTILGDGIFAWIPIDKIILAVICCIPVGVAVYFIKKLVIDRKKSNENE